MASSQDGHSARVFIIGWDGATFDLIRPWVAAGKLPNIARLMANGVHGSLRSTIPPWTFPAWTSFMTGKNPGKHGIYDFFRPRPGTYELEFVNGGHRRADTFWKILSEAGRKVVSISVPCTFPPEPVNGAMISGFDFPGEGPGSFVDARGMYPPELYEELRRNVGRHPIDAAVAKDINQGRPEVALDRILATIRQKAQTAKYLLSKRDWDCFMILFGESDGAGHQFWKYCDPHSPLFVDRPDLRDSLLRVYRELDRQAGELLALLPSDATVMMMSDHGFGGVGDWLICPNCWLCGQGFLHFRSRLTGRWARRLEAVKHRAVVGLPAWLQRLVYRLGNRLVGRLEASLRYGAIDWSRTEAYFDENPYFPVLRVNLKGRQPEGIIEPGEQYERVRDRLIERLEAWRHPATGERVVEKAYRREEVYDGPCLSEAADVVAKWALHGGYNYAFKLSSKSPGSGWSEHADPRCPETQQFYSSKSGSHRDDGIFLCHGPNVRRGASLDGARIIDLAPTLLRLLGVEVPADMDGRVLDEILAAPGEAVGHDRVNGNGHCAAEALVPAFFAAPAEPAADACYSETDQEKVGERLRALGYIE